MAGDPWQVVDDQPDAPQGAAPQGGGSVADMLSGGGDGGSAAAPPPQAAATPQAAAAPAPDQPPPDQPPTQINLGAAQPPAGPKKDFGLGVKAGLERPWDTMSLRLEDLARQSGVPVDQINNWYARTFGGPGSAGGIQAQHEADIAKAAQQGRVPSRLGEIAGNTALATATAPAGLVEGGLLSGAMLSQAPVGDWADVAKDSLLSAGTGVLTDLGLKGLGNAAVSAATKNINPAKAVTALRNAKNAAYDTVKNMGVEFSPTAIDNLQSNIADTFRNFGANATTHAPAYGSVKDMFDELGQQGSATLQNVDRWRQNVMRDVVGSNQPGVSELGSQIVKNIDGWMDNLTGHDILPPGGHAQMGPPSAAQMAAQAGQGQKAQLALAAARDANRQYRTVDLLNQKAQSAALKAKSTYSGQNIDNRFRQTFRPLLDPTSNANITRFLTPDERNALTNIVEGSGVQNALRTVGSLGGSGLKMLTNLGVGGGVGAATHSPALGLLAGLGPTVAGNISKGIANAATKAKVGNLIDLAASGGTRAGQQAAQAGRAAAFKNQGLGSWLATAGQDVNEWARGAQTAWQQQQRGQSRYGR